ncbi:MAG: MFS transporter [Spirochaetes bacterium]|nr:MFS transporter [Spirochaetota bacterium]
MFTQLSSSEKKLYFFLLINFVIFGASSVIKGAVIPEVIKEYQWDYIQTSLLFSAGSLSFLITSFLTGFIVNKVGPKITLIGGLFCQTLGLAFFGITSSLILAIFMMVLISIGHGASEVISNLSVVRIEKNGESRLMNLMHSFFSLGAIAGPFICGFFLLFNLHWRIIYLILTVFSLAVFILFSFASFQSVHQINIMKKKFQFRNLHILLILFFIILFYVSSEMGISSWISEYLIKTKGSSSTLGAYTISLFWLGLFLGRSLTSVLYKGTKSKHILLLFSLSGLLFIFPIPFIQQKWISLLLLLLLGFSFSIIYPIVMTIAGTIFQKDSSSAVGIIASGGGLGCFAYPILFGYISEKSGINKGFYLFIALTLAYFLLSLLLLFFKSEQKE